MRTEDEISFRAYGKHAPKIRVECLGLTLSYVVQGGTGMHIAVPICINNGLRGRMGEKIEVVCFVSHLLCCAYIYIYICES